MTIEIIKKDFEANSIKFLKKDDKIWITSSTIARGLGIDRRNVNSIFNNNKELLEPFSRIINLMSRDNRPRDVRVFDKVGFIGICMRSNSPKAVPFQKWALNVIDSIVKTGQYIEKKNLHPLEVLKSQNEAMGKIIEYQLDQNRELEAMKQNLLTFEQKYEDERIITPQTMKQIRDIIQKAHIGTGLHWGTLYKKIFDHFKISNIKNTTEKLGQKIIEWLGGNPPFNSI